MRAPRAQPLLTVDRVGAGPGTSRPSADRAAVLAFGAVLVLPGLWGAFDGRPVEAAEREWRAPRPEPTVTLDAGSLESFPRRFDAWFADAHGLREPLIRLHHRIVWFALRTSPIRIMGRGRGDWLFNKRYDALAIDSGAAPLAPAALDAWHSAIAARRAACADLGARYLFVVAPPKGQVYPERLPPRIEPGAPTRFDQLLARLNVDVATDVLDLRAALDVARSESTPEDWLYFPLGIHWTSRGAFVGHRAILERLGATLPGLEPVARDEVLSIPRAASGDNWSRRLYLEDFLSQKVTRLALPERGPLTRTSADARGKRVDRTERTDGPKVLLFGDSFVAPIVPFLELGVGTLVVSRQFELDLELIEAERPDAVVQLHGGRLFGTPPPGFTVPARQWDLARRFAAVHATTEDEDPWTDLRLVGPGRLDKSSAGALLDASALAHRVVMPELAAGPGAVLRLALRCAERTSVELWARAGDGRDRRLADQHLAAGGDELFVPLDVLSSGERLALSFTAGVVRIEELTVRLADAELPRR